MKKKEEKEEEKKFKKKKKKKKKKKQKKITEGKNVHNGSTLLNIYSEDFFFNVTS